MPTIYLAEEHNQVYHIWQEQQDRNLKVTHIDFHCDMRGLMIDRSLNRAFMTSPREAAFVDPGNYLGHAIMNGIISDLRWVHGPLGGRLFDTGEVVKYETDFLAPWYVWKHRQAVGQESPIRFKESLFEDWPGPRPGEHLDIDWDAFASIEYPPEHTEKLIRHFLAREFSVIPETTFLVFSPGYSQPDRSRYERFANTLAAKFGAEMVQLVAPQHHVAESKLASLKKAIRRHTPSGIKNIKRNLVLKTRLFTARNDLVAGR